MAAGNDNTPDALLPDLDDTAELPALSEQAAEQLAATDTWQVPADARTDARPAGSPAARTAAQPSAPEQPHPVRPPRAAERPADEADPRREPRPGADPAQPPELSQLRARCEQYLERLQDLEGQRLLLEGLIDEYEHRLEERGQRAEALERRLLEQSRELRSARARLARLGPQAPATRARWPQLPRWLSQWLSRWPSQWLPRWLSRWPSRWTLGWPARWLSALAPIEPAASPPPRLLTGPETGDAPRPGPQLGSAAPSEPDAWPQPHAVPQPDAMPEPGAALLPLAALVPIEGEGSIVRLGRRTTIGRLPGNDICIAGDAVSRHHAVVLANGEGVVLEDLNSTNGTFVNGARVARCTLKDGDLLTIGRTRLRYVMHAPPA